MADEIRNGDSKVRVVRLLGHRDDTGAWERIYDRTGDEITLDEVERITI